MHLVEIGHLPQACLWNSDDGSMEFCHRIGPNFVLELTAKFKNLLVIMNFLREANSTYIVSFLGLLLCQTRYSQHFSSLQEWTQRSLVNIHLTVIYEFHECMQICKGDILKHDYWMLTRCALRWKRKICWKLVKLSLAKRFLFRNWVIRINFLTAN